jgi:hypothetical protein
VSELKRMQHCFPVKLKVSVIYEIGKICIHVFNDE